MKLYSSIKFISTKSFFWKEIEIAWGYNLFNRFKNIDANGNFGYLYGNKPWMKHIEGINKF